MKISIVIPAYNEEKTISSTIEAALSQKYPDFEVIVVNNASTDKTQAVIDTYVRTHPQNVRTVTEHTKGLLHARECGRIHAKGDIIANLDADCLPDPHWLTTGARFFTDPQIVAVSGPYDYYDGGFVLRHSTLIGHKYLFTTFNRILRITKKGGYITGGNTLIRASALAHVGGYTTSILFWGEDTNTATKLSKAGKIVFTKKLIMKTSGRRFKNQGFWKTTWNYQMYFVKMIFGKKHL